MTTFDYNQVKSFTSQLNQKLDQCENGEGMMCESVDIKLKFCAERCMDFYREIQKWAQDVFSGRVAFDPAAEQLWIAELLQLETRSIRLLNQGKQSEAVCFILEGCGALQSALWNLYQLMTPWVTPKLAVGPSSRQEIFSDAALAHSAIERINQLPALSADWKPYNQQQVAAIQSLRHLQSGNR
ncbi:MAG: hypothetical protein M3O30_15095 [Planctomycetota bacterium]|nr:hypothetical protein [Planctomycetota bacterium]